jgi:hypothetical protein
MSIYHDLLAALKTALPNTWAVELPERPTWPAAVFNVESLPEDGWVAGVAYVRHTVNLVVLNTDLDALEALLPIGAGGAFRAALEALDAYQLEESAGDAAYEPDPKVYGRSLVVQLRTMHLN